MASTYGENLRFTIFGQSHSPAVGVTIEGFPAGMKIDLEKLQAFLHRRAPGNSPLSTGRRETDVPQFLSGLVDGHTCGAPMTVMIPNTDIRPQDYVFLRDIPRPGHADFTASQKFDVFHDASGGGHFSGRLTSGLCVVGGICKQLLEYVGVTIAAHIRAISHVEDRPFDPAGVSDIELKALLQKEFPTLSVDAGRAMKEAILAAKAQGDSVGGIIECAATGLQGGWGDPIFGGMENRISQAVFGIPGIRGIEFGTGFAAAAMRGSEHNDPYYTDGKTVRTRTNHHGGILGGITSGMPLIFRVAVKPTPSIAIPQESVDVSNGHRQGVRPATITIAGRHDPCIVPRAVPCVEAATAVAIYDAFLQQRKEEKGDHHGSIGLSPGAG